MVVFVDSAAWIAIFDKHDQYHGPALRIRHELLDRGVPLVTTGLIMSESLTHIARRVDYSYAAKVGEMIYQSGAVAVVPVNRAQENHALQLMRKWADKKVSFCDCVSFAWLYESGNQAVFSFDKHFLYAGFRLIGIPQTSQSPF